MKRFSSKLAIAWLGIIVGGSILMEVFFPDFGLRQNVDRVLESPGWEHIFGTDSLGRDLFARILMGTKISLSVGIAGSVLALSLGVVYGLLSGWQGGWTDRLLMRATDLFLSIPSFALVAVIAVALQSLLPMEEGAWKSFFALTGGIGLTHWMNIARVTRGLVLRTKVLPYIEAAKALGGTDFRIVFRHVLPNISGALWILLGLQIPANILYESFMSFIGVGVQSPQTSWGLLVQEGWRSLSNYPHLILFPALVLFFTVWSLHLLIDEARGRQTPSS